MKMTQDGKKKFEVSLTLAFVGDDIQDAVRQLGDIVKSDYDNLKAKIRDMETGKDFVYDFTTKNIVDADTVLE